MDQQRMLTPREAAVNFHNQAIELALAGGDDNKNLAYRLFGSSVDVDPGFHEGFFQLGVANSDMGLGHAAVANFRRAIEAAPMDSRYWVNLGHQLYHLSRYDEGREATMRALEIDPRNALALCNLSIIQSTCGELHESLASALMAYEIAPDIPVIEFALAIAYLHLGQWALGLKHMEARFGYAKRMRHMLSFPYPKWNGESLSGRTLFLVADQGLGDTISMFRFIRMLDERAANEGGRVVAQFQSDLLRLCGIIFPGLRATVIGPMPQPLPMADCWVSTTGIPHAMGLDDEQIARAPQPRVPALPLPADPRQFKVPGRKLHVGVAWRGSKDNDIDRHRSFPVTELFELCGVEGVQLYSLQCGPASLELGQHGGNGLIRDLSPFIRDVVDTLAIMRELDLVISVESSPAHMAGLIGVDCWVPYSRAGRDWRFGYGDRPVLWCPKHRVFKQGADETWPPVFKRIAAALRERIGY